MADPEDSESLIGEFPGEVLDPATALGVESGRRFVHQQHLGIGEQGPGDAHALHLPSRQVVSDPVDEPGIETDTDKDLHHPFVIGIAERHPEIVADRSRVDRRLLENHSDLAPKSKGIEHCDVDTLERNDPRRRHIEAVSETQKSGLPCPRWPGDDQDVARVHMGRDVVQQFRPVLGRYRHPFEGEQDLIFNLLV